MDFGKALEAMKQGEMVRRKGWNGKGMFAYMVPANVYKTQTDAAKKMFGDKVSYNPYFALKTVPGEVSAWSPNTLDILAEDWEIIE